MALADEFDVVIVRDVPRLDLFLMNSMIKRFIIMIDQIYDNHVSIYFATISENSGVK